MENLEYYFSLLGGSGIILMLLTKLVNLLLPDKLPSIYIYRSIPNRFEKEVVNTLKCCFEESIPYTPENSKFTYYQSYNKYSYLNVKITPDNKYLVCLKPNTKVFFYNETFISGDVLYNFKCKLTKDVEAQILFKMWKGNRSEWSSEFLLRREEFPTELQKCSEYSITIPSMINDKICSEYITKEQLGIEFVNSTNENLEFIIDELFFEKSNINHKPTKKVKLFGFYIYFAYS